MLQVNIIDSSSFLPKDFPLSHSPSLVDDYVSVKIVGPSTQMQIVHSRIYCFHAYIFLDVLTISLMLTINNCFL